MSSSIASTKVELRYPWMFSKTFDAAFFFLPIFIGFGLYFLQLNPAVGASFFWGVLVFNAFGAGPFHLGPTWFAFFDKKNREYYGSTPAKKRIFFLMPALI